MNINFSFAYFIHRIFNSSNHDCNSTSYFRCLNVPDSSSDSSSYSFFVRHFGIVPSVLTTIETTANPMFNIFFSSLTKYKDSLFIYLFALFQFYPVTATKRDPMIRHFLFSFIRTKFDFLI